MGQYVVPERVPTPITRVSTRVSRVMVGPRVAIPLAIFLLTSSWLLPLKASWAKVVALERSIRSRKKNKASLKDMSK